MIDYTSAGIDFGMLAPEIYLLVMAFVVLVVGHLRKVHDWTPVIAIAGLLGALYFSIQQWGNQSSGFFGMVSCDSFGVAFKIIFSSSTLLTVMLARRYMRKKMIERPEFYALLLISTMGMMVMANTTDLVVMFLGLEIMSVPLYVLAGLARRSLQSNEAGIKYFIMGAFASAFLLMGIAFVFGSAETTELRRIVANFNFILNNHSVLFSAGIGLILIGFGFKIGIVPFHSWIPDVYQGAPTPITAFFSVGPKAAGLAVLLRIFLYGFAEFSPLTNLFWILAVITMTVGNVFALRQSNLKRLLAYSSIAHAGYMLVAFTVGGGQAISAVIFYMIGYTLFNLGAFAVVTMLETRSGCSSDLKEVAGLGTTSPYLAAILAVFMFALSGFPPTVGFFGKFYLFSTAVENGFYWLAIIGVMNSFVSVYYYLKVIKTAYFDSASATFESVSYTPAVTFVLFITLLGTLGFGLFPSSLMEFTKSAIFAFL